MNGPFVNFWYRKFVNGAGGSDIVQEYCITVLILKITSFHGFQRFFFHISLCISFFVSLCLRKAQLISRGQMLSNVFPESASMILLHTLARNLWFLFPLVLSLSSCQFLKWKNDYFGENISFKWWFFHSIQLFERKKVWFDDFFKTNWEREKEIERKN